PNWYASKQANHEVVPTWNYAVVHAYGSIMFRDDEKWLRGVIGKLTRTMELDQPKPWSMGQAPRDYLAAQLGDIVGVELPISHLIGKWKMSQNRIEPDQAGVITGLRQRNGDREIWIADVIDAAKPATDKH
ncbi:MAG: FMN-binding negative transcriptional regulator, partial [Thermomicrobiales bacterium]